MAPYWPRACSLIGFLFLWKNCITPSFLLVDNLGFGPMGRIVSLGTVCQFFLPCINTLPRLRNESEDLLASICNGSMVGLGFA